MTPNQVQMTRGTQADTIGRYAASRSSPGYTFEDAVLDALDMGETTSAASQYESSLVIEVAPYERIQEWLDRCRTQFAREMAFGLVVSAIQSYDSGDFNALGQAVVDWTSTLELEVDKKVVRRMRRRVQRNQHGSRTTVHHRT